MREKSFLGAIIFTLFLIPLTTYGQAVPNVQSDVQASAQGAVRLNVLTWNVRGGRCGEARAEVLTKVSKELVDLNRQYDLDVIALQEVYEYQAEGLRNAVNFRDMHFYPTFTCKDGKPRGNAILSRRRFERGSKRQHRFVYQHPEENDEQRNVIGASIRVEGRRVYLYDTHLTARADPNRVEPSRKDFCKSEEDSCESNFWRAQQAAESVEFVNQDRRSDNSRPFRAILMGDFNAERNPTIDFVNNAYDNLTNPQVTNNFRDAWAIWAHNEGVNINSSQGYTNPTGKPYDPAKKRIDYVLLSKSSGINVVRATRIKRTGNVSDHYPVLALLAFN